jgi:5-methylcytosine-specific restriction endonuclease McrA
MEILRHSQGEKGKMYIQNLNCSCNFCGKNFHKKPFAIKNGEGKYCSWKCYRGEKKTVEIVCKICGSSRTVWVSTLKRKRGKYCSHKCYSMGRRGTQAWNKGKPHMRLEKHPNWRGGISQEDYGLRWNEKLKESIRKRDGYSCMMCSRPQSMFKRKLDVHHIDENKKNSVPENLISLCMSCHMEIQHKFRGINVVPTSNRWLEYARG